MSIPKITFADEKAPTDGSLALEVFLGENCQLMVIRIFFKECNAQDLPKLEKINNNYNPKYKINT